MKRKDQLLFIGIKFKLKVLFLQTSHLNHTRIPRTKLKLESSLAQLCDRWGLLFVHAPGIIVRILQFIKFSPPGSIDDPKSQWLEFFTLILFL